MSAEDIQLDLTRRERLGFEEAVFCAHKSPAQIDAVLDRLASADRGGLLTRLEPEREAALNPAHRARLDYDPPSRTAFFACAPRAEGAPRIGIVTAGSSDVPVAREAWRTLAYCGVPVLPVFDVGVAGLWRLMERIEELRRLSALIVAAGMDAALPSVIGGLYGGLVIAVPTSVGYGVAAGGHTALNAILASCASGIVTVNIDNGYGAACAALRALGRP
ncbi:MAG TPA: nickel pincer cofactor biosynthesis protein LarB [Gammaproteobacteria bacterium]|nr:nickel pincer cofactor biosynthesis protein LarB [Gammaproteobacteria bacterium]